MRRDHLPLAGEVLMTSLRAQGGAPAGAEVHDEFTPLLLSQLGGVDSYRNTRQASACDFNVAAAFAGRPRCVRGHELGSFNGDVEK